MKLEREIKVEFGELASEVRPGPLPLEHAVGRTRRRARDRRFTFGAIAVALVAAVALVVPRLLLDKPSRLVVLDPAPKVTFSSSSDPHATPGLSVGMTLPLGAATAEIIEASVHIQDDKGSGPHVVVLWGDMPDQQQFANLIVDCADPHGKATPTQETSVLRHAYRAPGTYAIRVQVSTGYCQDTNIETVEVAGTLTITQGGTPSNGPLLPTAHIDDRRHLYDEVPASALTFFLGGGDEDGFVNRVVVEWGDGTSEILVDAPIAGCEESQKLWPSTYLDGKEVTHTYTPGTYTLTVTVTSVGCDGLDTQTASGTFELVSPS
jgi:hypothetical protein